MLKWTQIKQDLYNGVALLRRGLLTAAVESAQEVDRLKLRFRLHEVEEQLSESYRALGEYVLMKLESKHSDFVEDKEWLHFVREIDAKRAEREKLVAELKGFDRQGASDSAGATGDRERQNEK